MLFPTRSIGFPNRITNSPDHRLASRKFFSFWPGARTFPITDFHLDHCIEKWNAFGWGSDQFHISHLLKNYWFLYAFFCETVFCLSFLYWLAAGTAIVHSTILQLFMNPFDREIDWNLFLPPTPRQRSSNLASTVWMLLQSARKILALCSYILWCISKKLHSQWELLWQSMFSVDIEDVKLVHFHLHSHCDIDFDLWTSFRFWYFHFGLCTSPFFLKMRHGIECVKLATRSIGFSNRITNCPDHRLASRTFFSTRPGSRTFPITDFHLDYSMEKWNERIGMRKRPVSYQAPLKKVLFLLRGSWFKCGSL